MNESKNSLRGIFDEAAELDDAGERDAFLQRACGDDAELRGKIVDLLRAHKQPGGFLDAPVPGAAQKTIPAPLTEKPGDRIGRYKLLEQIGEGGCGTVYMAEQEEPVRRQVALKVIKLGMDTKSVIGRFEAERQALALMDHPNIAKVLDAGATETGRPYFVMELVRGIRITDYCDQNSLPTGQRLALFNQVCHAIQHAHQKGIIHRDIKPSNILVTLHDGVPVPKVIDFGIAKATTGQRLTDKTIFTAFEQFIGTPAYMSPEQAEMSGLDVDTRSDIYALGILLYELLTGKTPFDAKELIEAGLDAMRRTIREKEPARPSTRLSTMLAADRTTVARHRQTESAKLTALLRGDLDWIVMKALEKDRTRRYETASGFAADIQRHLNHEPVVARPPARFYRFQKLMRRNKFAFAAVSAVLAALLIGLGFSTWLFFKERDARQRAVAAEKEAKTEARKSRHVAGFLQDMLDSVGPSVALGRDTAMLREILDRTAERVDDLQDQPDVEAELRHTLGEVYLALGEYEKAESMAREALALRRRFPGNEDEDVGDSLNSLANVLWKRGNLAEAEAMHRETLAMRRKLLGNTHGEVAKSITNLGLVFESQGKLAEAETMHREALTMWRSLFGNEHPTTAMFLCNLASVLDEQGKWPEAEAMHREVLAMRMERLGSEHPDVAHSLNNLAAALWEQDKLDEAGLMHRKALALARKLYGHEHPNVATSLGNLASVLADQGRLAEAEVMHREALAMRRKLLGSEHPKVAASLDTLGTALDRQGKFSEAEAAHREALAMRRKLLGSEHPSVASSLNNLAHVILKQDKLTEAESLLREALAIDRKLLEPEHPDVAIAFHNLGSVLTRQGKLDEAEALHAEALAHTRTPAGNNELEVIRRATDRLLSKSGFAQAESLCREALATARKLSANDPPALEGPVYALADNLYNQRQYAEAEPLYREALTSRRGRLTAEDEKVLSFTASLARLLAEWAWAERSAQPITKAAARAAEAERLLRDCLAIRERVTTLAPWRIADVQSRLGEALVSVAVTDPALNHEERLAKIAGAEVLLVEGNARLQESDIAGSKYQRDAIARLVRHYQTWEELMPGKDKAAQATGWKNKLSEFDDAKAVKNSAE